MSSELEPAIWSRDTDQQIPCFDRCQLTITWMCNIISAVNWVVSWSMAAMLDYCY